MPETVYLHTDGTPVRPGICMMPDHFVETFTVTVRSEHPIHPDTIKRLIQARNEVTSVEKTAAICYVRNGK